MGKLERQAALCALLQASPGVYTVQELASALAATTRTVQRDLNELVERGAVLDKRQNRVHLTSVPAELLDPAPPATEAEVRLLGVLRMVYEEPGGFQPGVLSQAAAKHYETSERTILRDLEDLVARGLVEVQEGRCHPGRTLLPKLSLTADQVLALLSHLDVQRQLLPRQKALRAAEEKLRGALFGEAARAGAGANHATCLVKGRYYLQPPELEARVDLLDGACAQRRRVRFDYTSASGSAGPRLVEPLGLVYYWFHDAWYLVAKTVSEAEPGGNLRHFRLDRMDGVEVTGETFAAPPGFDLEEHLAPCWGIEHGALHTVRIRFFDEFNVLARVARETAHRAGARLTAEEGGSSLYTDEVAGLNELRVWVRSFGSSAVVLAPEELREELLESARRIVRRHAGEPGEAGDTPCACRPLADETTLEVAG